MASTVKAGLRSLAVPPFYHAPRAFWLDFPISMEREQALIDFCMHSKGYRLEQAAY
jgi:hypothetical protein